MKKPHNNKILLYLRDILLALLVGLAAGLVLGVVFLTLGALAGGILKGLSLMRSALMIAGALVLITCALQFLKGGNLPEDTFSLPFFKKHNDDTDLTPRGALPIFRVLSRRVSLVAVGAGIILVSAVPDYILMSLR